MTPGLPQNTVEGERGLVVLALLALAAGAAVGFVGACFRLVLEHADRWRDALIQEPSIGEVIKAGTLQTMIDDLAKIPLEFSPGEAWNYSVATDVLGYLIGLISGKPFEQFLKERIFDPLGMNDTDFFVPKEKAHRLAACYSAGVQIGSAYLRSGQLPEAERSYLEATQDDPKMGSAYNNLAVVYMMTGRKKEAEEAVRTAERVGFRVNPGLKDDIRKMGS